MRVVGNPSPGHVELESGPAPELSSGEVLVRVAAAGVNRPDLLQSKGAYPPPPGASPVLGLEVAGEVAEVSPDAERWRVGDQVCALVSGGGYAEYCAAPAAQCLPIPRGLSLVEAAALPENYFTVWTNVFERGGLKPGERILIHGGSSGIGTTAIQLAAAFGAYVITTAGSEEKCSACRELGADLAINYRERDFVADAGQVDVILDMVGGPYFERNLDCLQTEGRLVQIAVLQGSRVELNLGTVMQKRLTITGSTLRPRTVAQKAAIARELEAKVWPLLDARTVKPVIHKTFPLEEAASALLFMETNVHIGKIVLTVN